jgi:opacity protein-like surface antigen
MKKFGTRFVWLATTALASVMVVSAVQAADMPLKAPVPVISDWTGYYIGLHGGYGWARTGISDLDLRANPSLFSPGAEADTLSLHAPKLRGGVFGVHAGYNWQWAQRSVVGLEIDYSAADIKSRQAPSVAFPDHVDTHALTAKLDGLASARARVGYLLGPELLLYGTGGAAWGHTRFTDTTTFHDVHDDTNLIFASRASANHFGWVAGVGAEWKLWASGLMLRVEYLHYGFGSASLPFDTTKDNDTVISKGSSFNVPLDRLTTDIVRGGVSYKF